MGRLCCLSVIHRPLSSDISNHLANKYIATSLFAKKNVCIYFKYSMSVIIAGCVANSVDPDWMLHSVTSDLGLQACLYEG